MSKCTVLVTYLRPEVMFSHQGFPALPRERGWAEIKGGWPGLVRVLKANPSCCVFALARDSSKKYHWDRKLCPASQVQAEQV
jgi:hypothetical protein